MSRLKSYNVRLWRKGDSDGSDILGVVEELEEKKHEGCETIEGFLEVVRSRRSRGPWSARRVFSSFEELRRILSSF